VRRAVCLAVEWVAWAVWTINPTLNRNDEGPGFFRASFLVPQPRQIRVFNALWSCAEITQLLVGNAGKKAAELSFLFLRENRVPIVLISFRNRFLALAPAIAGGCGVSNAAGLCLGCVYT